MSNKVLKLGESLRALLVVAQSSTPSQWREHHPLFCRFITAWLQEFRSLESSFERIPEGWPEMVAKESEMEMAAAPPLLDSETVIVSKKGARKRKLTESESARLKAFSEHNTALRLASWWLPLWQKLFPAIRGHQGKAPPDGPVGDRGWRHNGVEISGLHGGETMEAMRELFDKPFGYSICRDYDIRKLRQLINENCKKIGLPWRVGQKQRAGTLTKIKPK
jgi:hypothetical protein